MSQASALIKYTHMRALRWPLAFTTSTALLAAENQMAKTYLKHSAKLREVSPDILSEFFAFLTRQAALGSRRENKQR